MKVLVTGIEGYIGSMLAPLLAERGHEIVGKIAMTAETFESRAYTRLKQLERLVATARIDDQFFGSNELPMANADGILPPGLRVQP